MFRGKLLHPVRFIFHHHAQSSRNIPLNWYSTTHDGSTYGIYANMTGLYWWCPCGSMNMAYIRIRHGLFDALIVTTFCCLWYLTSIWSHSLAKFIQSLSIEWIRQKKTLRLPGGFPWVIGVLKKSSMLFPLFFHDKHLKNNPCWGGVSYGFIWGFPKMVVPPNHLFLDSCSLTTTIHKKGYPHDYGNTHMV